MSLVLGGGDRLRSLREGEECSQALVLGTEAFGLAGDLLESALKVAFRHDLDGRALYWRRLSARLRRLIL